jgi:hypothetical protein
MLLQHHFALYFVSTPGSVHQFRQDDVIKEHLDRLPPGEFLFSKATHRALEGALGSFPPHGDSTLIR